MRSFPYAKNKEQHGLLKKNLDFCRQNY